MPYSLNPEVAMAMAKAFGTASPPPRPAIGDVESRRAGNAGLFEAVKRLYPPVADVESKDFHTKSDKDNHDILLRWYTKKDVTPPGSAVLYIHGGGMICFSIAEFDELIKRYVSRTGVPFMAIEYRLAPEARAPTQVLDCYAGLRHLHENAGALGVDPNRIAVMGDSAGGGVAAALAHYVKLQGRPGLCKQILIYPMLGDRTTTADPDLEPFLVWSPDDNQTGWGALLGDRCGAQDLDPVEAPGRMTVRDAKGLPPTYIDVGQLDLFRDEDLEYAQKLSRAGVSCEVHQIPQVPHGYDLFAPESEPYKTIMMQRDRVLKSL